jgi:hypothetical protein
LVKAKARFASFDTSLAEQLVVTEFSDRAVESLASTAASMKRIAICLDAGQLPGDSFDSLPSLSRSAIAGSALYASQGRLRQAAINDVTNLSSHTNSGSRTGSTL